MKVKNILMVWAILVATCLFAVDKNEDMYVQRGEELYMQKCVSCHLMEMPEDRSQMLGPPLTGLIYHMYKKLITDEKVFKHTMNFTINPSKETTICERCIKRNGLMISLRNMITDNELYIVSKWMVDNKKRFTFDKKK
ncbi:MAG: hypothetical protein ACJAWW_000254 [Sulfurimonas sp.]|jgi:hypothetical protein